jgi:hypothetical protein
MTADTTLLNDHILRILIRFFRTGDHVVLGRDTLRLADDLEFLRIQWALCPQVGELVSYLLENRHEAQASLETVLRDQSSIVRGRLAPARTVIRRRITGDYTQVSYYEPRRTYTQGPNHVLAWVLRYSQHILQRYLQLLSGSAEYHERTQRIFKHMAALRHLKGIGDAVNTTTIRLRPTLKSIIECGRARKRLYRKAYSAYQMLTRIEAGNDAETIELLNGSLIGPLEDWQKFELFVALKLAEAMASALGNDLILRPIQLGADRPIATFGDYDVYWQSRTPYQRFPDLEPSERITNDILLSYGIPVGADRPDVVICNRQLRMPVAIAEAKYSASGTNSGREAFREATAQLVRYSRLYTHVVPQDELLRRSVIAVSNLGDDIRLAPVPTTSPIALGFHDFIDDQRIATWIDRIRVFAETSTVSPHA